jgi:hypothetical protein
LTPGPPSTTVAAPGAQVLPPENGYVFIETKSGKTRCQLSAEEVGCEAQFTNPPVLDGVPANGVRVTVNGEVSWLVGNLGDIPLSRSTIGRIRRWAGPSMPARTARGSPTTAPATA